MNDLVAMLVLAAALAGLGFFHWRESQAWRCERADLLNRIMARTYTDFIYTTQTSTADVPQLLTDDAEAKWHREHVVQTEATDIEWHRRNMAEHPEQYPDGLPDLAAA